MNLHDITLARLNNQQIAAPAFTKVKEVFACMGALQAQDYAMAKWAIGLRLKVTTEKQVEQALDKGTVLRTHLLRPTWHFVAADDIYWLLALTAARIKAAGKFREQQLGLTDKTFNKSNAIIKKCLQGGQHLVREELAIHLEEAGIKTGGNRLSHLLLRAELEGIACSGKKAGNKKTYALLEERVPYKKPVSRETSLAALAKKYFVSRGPATVKDFTWWSGLVPKEAQLALEMVKPGFDSISINNERYYYSILKRQHTTTPSVHLLPAFDEFIISYKDRTASLAAHHQKKVLSVNGIFNPVIIVNGQVTGLWKRSIEKDQVTIETTLFQSHNKAIRNLIEEQAQLLQAFSGLRTIVRYRTV